MMRQIFEESKPAVTEADVKMITGAVRTAAALVTVAQQAVTLLRIRAESAQAIRYSDMPKGCGAPRSLADYVVQLEEKAERMAEIGRVEVAVIARVSEIFSRLDDPQEQALAGILYLSHKKISTERALAELQQAWGGTISRTPYYGIKRSMASHLVHVITLEDVHDVEALLDLARDRLRAPSAA